MKRFAVGYLSFFENDLIVEIVEAEDFKSAIMNHSKLKSSDEDMKKYLEEMPETLEDVIEEFANGEIAIDVKEIV